MKKSVYIGVFCLSILVGACSSVPTNYEVAEEQYKISKLKEKQTKKINKSKNENNEYQINALPKWIVNPPKNDATGVYSVGLGTSSSIDVALKKAKLNAEYELSKRYKSELSAIAKNYSSDKGASYELAIKNITDSVNISGYEVIKQKIDTINGEIVAYIMIFQKHENLEFKDDSDEHKLFEQLKEAI